MFKSDHHKVNYSIALTTVSLFLIFPVDATFSQTKKTGSWVHEELIAQAQIQKQDRKEIIRLNKEGLQLLEQGKYKEALILFEKALLICKQLDDKDAEGSIINNIGGVYENIKQYPKALEYYQKALNISKQLNDKPGEGTALNNIGAVYDNLNQYQNALKYYQESLAIRKIAGNKSREAQTINSIAGVYVRLRQYKEALDYYQQALIIRKQINEAKGVIYILHKIGAIYEQLEQYKESLIYYQQLLSIYQQLNDKTSQGKAFNKIAAVYDKLGQYKDSLEYYQKALEISKEFGDKPGEGDILNNIGVVYDIFGQYKKALEYYQQALAIRQQQDDKLGQGITLNYIGLAYQNLGKYQIALDYYQQSLAIRKKRNDKAGHAQSLNNIGEIFRYFGQYQKALEYYEQALPISKQVNNKVIESACLNNIAFVYQSWGQNQKALKYYEQALARIRQAKYKPGETKIIISIGVVYRNLGEYQQALDYYQQALGLSKQINDKLGEGIVINNIGEVYLNWKQYDKALDYFQQSLDISQKSGDKAGEAISFNNIGGVYIFKNQYFQAEKPLFDAITIWEELRLKLTDDQKISIFNQQLRTYKLLQNALLSQNKIEQSLEVSERGRARAFIDLLTSKVTNNNDAIGKLPTITNIKIIAQKQKLTLVEYSVHSEELYVWVVKPTREIAFNKIDLKSLKTPLNKLVENSRFSIGVRGRGIKASQVPETNHQNRLQELHEVLIKPIAKHLPQNPDERVVFIPDESLFLVPFPALVDEKQKYLIEKHTILTAPAIQVLEFTDKSNQKPVKFAALQEDEKLIVGNPIMPYVGIPPKQLSNLPGAERETKLIASLLNAKPLIGKDATKSQVMKRMKNAKLIHLATHGLLDGFGERIPGAIALAPDSLPSPKQPNEGLLRTTEIIENLKIQADLIVLSACDTGKGEISGDGVQGLSRALLTAGAKSLIVSLWQVPDEATSDLMVEFYQQLEKNPDKAFSLRQAMLKTMRKYRSAANWAAFTIIGNPE